MILPSSWATEPWLLYEISPEMSRRKRREQPGPSGFLVVDKPAGQTSHDLVDAARRWLGTQRIGHLGTLDPQATGVLPLAVRDATKLIPFVPAAPKIYRGIIHLGVETDTFDGDGTITHRHDGALPELRRIEAALASFVGEHEQTPPMFSAVKHGGVPLYRLARRGERVERAPRKVRISEIELLSRSDADLEVRVECSPGTYVRVIAADLGDQLGCGAYLKTLCRLQSGPFTLEHAHPFERLERAAEDADARLVSGFLLRPSAALGLPTLKLRPGEAQRVRNGAALPTGGTPRSVGERVAALDPTGTLIAILEVADDRRLRPLRVLGGAH